jgi:hypothetical protein
MAIDKTTRIPQLKLAAIVLGVQNAVADSLHEKTHWSLLNLSEEQMRKLHPLVRPMDDVIRSAL